MGILLAAWPIVAPASGDALSQAFSVLERAFGEGAAHQLRPLLPARGKILVSMPSLGLAEEYVSGSQCEYLLDGLFQRFPVRSFELESRAPRTPPDDRLTVRGRLTVVGEERRRRILALHVLLSREGEAWKLREIREHTPR